MFQIAVQPEGAAGAKEVVVNPPNNDAHDSLLVSTARIRNGEGRTHAMMTYLL